MNELGRVGLEIHQKKTKYCHLKLHHSFNLNCFIAVSLKLFLFVVIYFIPMLFTARVESNCLKEKEKNDREDIEEYPLSAPSHGPHIERIISCHVSRS